MWVEPHIFLIKKAKKLNKVKILKTKPNSQKTYILEKKHHLWESTKMGKTQISRYILKYSERKTCKESYIFHIKIFKTANIKTRRPDFQETLFLQQQTHNFIESQALLNETFKRREETTIGNITYGQNFLCNIKHRTSSWSLIFFLQTLSATWKYSGASTPRVS